MPPSDSCSARNGLVGYETWIIMALWPCICCGGVEMSSMPKPFWHTENSFGEKNALLDALSGERVDYGMTRVTRAARLRQKGERLCFILPGMMNHVY